MLDENRVHDGHRKRMRDKFEAYGQEIFEDYELIEMLLYNVLPQLDTNPIAKRLLDRFGSVDGVLSAPPSELEKVTGIGKKAGEFISRVGSFTALPKTCGFSEMPSVLDSSEKVGRYLANYFDDSEIYTVALMLLDNSMRLISVETIGNFDLESGALPAKVFIERALLRGASAAVVAHKHPHGPLFPSTGDVIGYEMLQRELESVGVYLLESYIVTCGRYIAMSTELGGKDRFHSFVKFRSNLPKDFNTEQGQESAPKRSDSVGKILFPLLSSIMKDEKAQRVANNIESGLQSIRFVFESDFVAMRSFSGIPDSAIYLMRLCAALASRRMTEVLKIGEKYDEEKLDSFVKGIFLDKARETVCIISYDKNGNCAGASLVGEGTVNQSGIVPRRLLERAVCNGAKYVYIAHNHPRGNSEPSGEDISSTARLVGVFAAAGIELKAHFIVAGIDCRAIGLSTGDGLLTRRDGFDTRF